MGFYRIFVNIRRIGTEWRLGLQSFGIFWPAVWCIWTFRIKGLYQYYTRVSQMKTLNIFYLIPYLLA